MIKYLLSNKEFQRMNDEYNKVKIKCKHCGHKMVIPVWVDKRPCSWCGNNVYRNKKMEFTETLKKYLKKKECYEYGEQRNNNA